MSVFCPQCGAPAADNAYKCEYCGATLAQNVQNPQLAAQNPQVVYVQQNAPYLGERANWPVKSKIVAAILAFFLGGLGIHKFYLGKTGMGVLYLLFCWTYIPSFIAFIEGIIILCSNDENFQIKYKCRLG